jgi:hypothetical protein
MESFRAIVGRAILLAALLAAGTACVQAQVSAIRASAPSIAPVERSLVLVELFTSEGCPHCPTADAMLERLYSVQALEGVEIVALEEHVDYWDRPEWVDRYSSPFYTRRQLQYVKALEVESVYTPQMVVDGLVEFVGNSEGRARVAISTLGRVPKAAVRIVTRSGTGDPKDAKTSASVSVSLEVNGPNATAPAEVYLVLAEDKLFSRVSGGNNAGASWPHAPVARWMRLVGTVEPGEKSYSASVTLDPAGPDWRTGNLRLIAIVQEKQSRRVLAVGSAPLTPLHGAAGAATATPETSHVPDSSKMCDGSRRQDVPGHTPLPGAGDHGKG